MTIAEITKDYKGKVVFACKTGSQLFCDNCKDKDVIVVLDDNSIDKILRLSTDDGYDVFLYSQKDFEKLAKASFGNYRDLFSLAVGLASKSGNTLYGANPIPDYNWFDCKEKLLPWVYAIDISQYPQKPPRTYVWIYAIVVALSQNSLDFGEETKQKFQQIHDGEMSTADLLNEIMSLPLGE